MGGGLESLRLKEYPWIPISWTANISDRLEKSVLLLRFSISQLTLKAGSIIACAFEGLDNEDLDDFRQNYSEAE